MLSDQVDRLTQKSARLDADLRAKSDESGTKDKEAQELRARIHSLEQVGQRGCWTQFTLGGIKTGRRGHACEWMCRGPDSQPQ